MLGRVRARLAGSWRPSGCTWAAPAPASPSIRWGAAWGLHCPWCVGVLAGPPPSRGCPDGTPLPGGGGAAAGPSPGLPAATQGGFSPDFPSAALSVLGRPRRRGGQRRRRPSHPCCRRLLGKRRGTRSCRGRLPEEGGGRRPCRRAVTRSLLFSGGGFGSQAKQSKEYLQHGGESQTDPGAKVRERARQEVTWLAGGVYAAGC